MKERVTNAGAKPDRIEAVADQAEAIAEKGSAGINAVLSGGRSATKISSETAHQVSAAIARDVDAGRPIRSTAEYVREATRRR